MSLVLAAAQLQRLKDHLGDKWAGAKWAFDAAEARAKQLSDERDKAKAEAMNEKVNSEHLLNQLEQRFVSLRQDHTLLSAQMESLRAQHSRTLEERNALSTKLKSVQAAKESVDAALTASMKKTEQVVEEKRRALEVCARRQQEVDNLQAELSTSAEQLNARRQRAAELDDTLNRVRDGQQPLQLEVERLRRAKELTDKHNAWLEGELQTSNEELLAGRKEATATQMQLQTKLDVAQQKGRELESRAGQLEEQVRSQSSSINTALEEIKEIKSGHAAAEEEWQQRISSQERLTALYKDQARDNDEKAEQTAKVVAALKKALAKKDEQYAAPCVSLRHVSLCAMCLSAPCVSLTVWLAPMLVVD